MRYLLVLILSLSITTTFAQSKAVRAFQQQHDAGQKFHLYPSTLRMVNLEKNPDAYRLVNDVKKLQILLFERNDIARPAVQQLRQDIQQENYEELISFQQQDSQVTVYARGEGQELDGVVGVVDNQQNLALIDLAGFIDLPSLVNLLQSDYDLSVISGLVGNVMGSEGDEDTNEVSVAEGGQ